MGLPLLATNEPCTIGRQDRHLLDVLTSIQHHTTLDQAGRLLAANSERFMKDGRTMERLFSDCLDAVANTGELALRLGFTLKNLGYQFPTTRCCGADADRLPPGARSRGTRTRYGTGPLAEKARKQIERELSLIGGWTWRATSSSSGT
jgi:error-prone DNA polymerase